MSSGSAYDRVCAYCYGMARRALAPQLRNSQYAYAETLRQQLQAGGRWLDLGCGHDFLPSWMAAAQRTIDTSRWRTFGIDMDPSSIRRHQGLDGRLVGNIERLPFRDDAFSLVTANMVVEHVRFPDQLFAEIARVLAPGGALVIHTPNVNGYTTALTRLLPERLLSPLAGLLLGREAEDVYPTFYRANSRPAIDTLAGTNGLMLADFHYVASSSQLVRIPPLMFLEVALIRLLERPALASHRACILATFTKPAGTGQSTR